MSDEQLKRKADIKKILIGSALIFLVACCLFYFRWSTSAEVEMYKSSKSQEASVQSTIDSLTASNAELSSIIEETGKELVSFSEDKIKYINLASELSIQHSVRINKLVVSDVFQDGEMSCMTTTLEVQGDLTNVKDFVEEYCSTHYTNRINVVSCRPLGNSVWLSRDIDDENVLTWFDLSSDESMQEQQKAEEEQERYQQQSKNEFGLPITDVSDVKLAYSYDPISGKFFYNGTSVEVPQEVLDETPLTLDKMFANKPIKAYLVIDFLGRA